MYVCTLCDILDEKTIISSKGIQKEFRNLG